MILQISLISRWPDGGQSIIRLVNPFVLEYVLSKKKIVREFFVHFNWTTFVCMILQQARHSVRSILCVAHGVVYFDFHEKCVMFFP